MTRTFVYLLIEIDDVINLSPIEYNKQFLLDQLINYFLKYWFLTLFLLRYCSHSFNILTLAAVLVWFSGIIPRGTVTVAWSMTGLRGCCKWGSIHSWQNLRSSSRSDSIWITKSIAWLENVDKSLEDGRRWLSENIKARCFYTVGFFSRTLKLRPVILYFYWLIEGWTWT